MKTQNPWGANDLMVVTAFRYCCGRQTYIVGECADWLIQHWSEFSQNTRSLIQRELEEEFRRDDEARKSQAQYKPLGWDCDRKEWERVRRLWAA